MSAISENPKTTALGAVIIALFAALALVGAMYFGKWGLFKLSPLAKVTKDEEEWLPKVNGMKEEDQDKAWTDKEAEWKKIIDGMANTSDDDKKARKDVEDKLDAIRKAAGRAAPAGSAGASGSAST